MATGVQSREYDELHEALKDLTGAEIVKVVDLLSSEREGQAFAAIVAGLPDAAVRLLAARAFVGLAEDPEEAVAATGV